MTKNVSISNFSLFVSLIAAIGGLLFGFNTSVISGAMLFISQKFDLTTLQQELIVSFLLVGALIGALSGGLLADRVGRRTTLIFTAALFIISSICQVMSDSLMGLIIGRFLSGAAIGLASLTVPLYISEMSISSSRGILVSLNQLAVTIGILLSYFVDFAFASSGNWRWMIAFGLFPAMAMLIGLLFVPETPAWLASMGKKELATRILGRIHLKAHEEEPVAEIESRSHDHGAHWKELFGKGVRHALLIGIMISVFQQITGINAVIYYAPRIFQIAGFQSAESATLATLGIGVINVLMTFVALWLIDIVGRRRLLLVGLSGMIFCLAILGMAFMSASSGLGFLSVLSLMGYVSFFAISLGPVAWLIISEIYPLHVRGRAMSIATFANWTSNFIVSLTFLSLVEWFGAGGAFWLYTMIAILALWFISSLVPETKGKTLLQIQEFWKKHYDK